MSDTTNKRGGCLRAFLILFLLGVALMVVLVGGFVYAFATPSNWQPGLEETLSKQAKLPVDLGEIALVLSPFSLESKGILVGEPDFNVAIDRLNITAKPMRLFMGLVDIDTIAVEGLRVTLPEDEAAAEERLNAYAEQFEDADSAEESEEDADEPTTGDGAGPSWLHIQSVSIPDLVIALGERAIVTGSATGNDVLGEETILELGLNIPYVDAETRFDARATITQPTRPAPAITGEIALANFDVEDFLKNEDVPATRIGLGGTIEGNLPDDLAMVLDGTVNTNAAEGIAGTIAGKAWVKGQDFIVNDFKWDSPGLSLEGDLTVAPDKPVAAKIPRAEAVGDGLRTLLAAIPLEGFTLRDREGAHIRIEDLLVGGDDRGDVRLASGTVSLGGIDLGRENDPAAVRNLQGKLQIAENVVTLETLTSEGVTINGVVRPDFATGDTAVEMSARANLGGPILNLAAAPDQLANVAGTLEITKFAATFPGDGSAPRDLVVTGSVTGARASVNTPDMRDEIRSIEATFTTANNVVDAKVRLASAQMGDAGFDGKYDVAEAKLSGVLTANLENVADPFIGDDEQARKYANALLEPYGLSEIDINATLPTSERPGADFALARRGDPPLQGTVTLKEVGDDLELDTIDFNTRVLLEGLADVVPENVTIAGLADVRFAKASGAEQFTIDVDLGQSTVGAGEYVEKKAGGRLLVQVSGSAEDMNLDTVNIGVLEEDIVLALDEDGVVRTDSLDVELAKLAGLFKNGATASGRVTGSLVSEPIEANLTFGRVAIALNPDAQIDSLTGGVAYREGFIEGKDVRLVGVGSDLTLNASMVDDRFDAIVRGERLDVNAIDDFLSALTGQEQKIDTDAEPLPGAPAEPTAADLEEAGTPAPAESEEEPTDGPLLPEELKNYKGTVDVDIKALHYLRANVDGVKVKIDMQETGIQVPNAVMSMGEGVVTATMTVAYGSDTAPPTVDAVVQLDNADLKTIDDFVFVQPRLVRGQMTGEMALQSSLASVDDLLNSANGRVKFTATEGPYGRLGVATKLLTALRTVEIIRLKAPALKDEGLVFDQSVCDLVMTNGVFEAKQFDITSKAYAMETSAKLDFPQDTAKGNVQFNLLQVVTGITEKIPVLGQATNVLKDRASVHLVMRGSARDPRFFPDPTMGVGKQIKDVITNPARGIRDIIGL